MIIIPDFTHFRNGEFVKFGDLSISILNNYTFEKPKIQEQIQAVTTAHESAKSIYKIDRGSQLTKEIVNEDMLRDNMNSAIRLILQAHANYHPDEETRKKAENLLAVFEKHGTELNKQGYHLQTANLDDIFSDIINKSLQGDITDLGCGLYYSTLTASNQRFDALYLERNKEYAEAPKEKMADLRQTSEDAIKKLFNMINAAVVFDDPAVYQPVIDELNSLIESYVTAINRRQSAQQEGDERLNQDFDEVKE